MYGLSRVFVGYQLVPRIAPRVLPGAPATEVKVVVESTVPPAAEPPAATAVVIDTTATVTPTPEAEGDCECTSCTSGIYRWKLGPTILCRYVSDVDRRCVLVNDAISAARQLLDWYGPALSGFPGVRRSVPIDALEQVVFIGIDIKDFLKQIAIECAQAAGADQQSVFPPGAWLSPEVPPIDTWNLALTAGNIGWVTSKEILKAYALDQQFPDYKAHRDARADLVIALAMARKFGLLANWDAE